MSEEKLRRINAAVSVDEEVVMEETDSVLEGEGAFENDCTCQEQSEQGDEPEQSVVEEEREEEPANWVGRLPLSSYLALWRENRETERFVALIICVFD